MRHSPRLSRLAGRRLDARRSGVNVSLVSAVAGTRNAETRRFDKQASGASREDPCRSSARALERSAGQCDPTQPGRSATTKRYDSRTGLDHGSAGEYARFGGFRSRLAMRGAGRHRKVKMRIVSLVFVVSASGLVVACSSSPGGGAGGTPCGDGGFCQPGQVCSANGACTAQGGGGGPQGGGGTQSFGGGGGMPSGGAGGTGGTGGTGGCPVGLPGPVLVKVPVGSAGAYCMDATEVTNARLARPNFGTDGSGQRRRPRVAPRLQIAVSSR